MTEVVSAGAGLYVMDGKVGLCLAYQPPLRRKLRAGDSVQVSFGVWLSSISWLSVIFTFRKHRAEEQLEVCFCY